jgi:hypothetical protein
MRHSAHQVHEGGAVESKARVDVDWGGENVTLSINEGAVEVGVSISPDVARRMIHQLEWAIGEVARFAEHMEFGEEAGRFAGKWKP